MSKEETVDARGGKLLEFLKENNHLDLEVPDIAFSVKKSEKTVEAALVKLQQKGLVTARKNEYGRVYWYALPSAPITRTFKLADLKNLKEDPINGLPIDDEVDLSDLQNSSQSVKKTRKMATIDNDLLLAKPAAPKTVKILSIPEPAVPAKPVAETPKATEAVPVKPAPATEDDSLSFEPLQTGAALDAEPQEKGTFQFSTLILPALIIIGLMGMGGLLRSCDIEKNVTKIKSEIPKDVVPMAEITALKAEIAKVADLEKRVTALSAQLDSLKIVVAQTPKTVYIKSAPAVAKKPATPAAPSKKKR